MKEREEYEKKDRMKRRKEKTKSPECTDMTRVDLSDPIRGMKFQSTNHWNQCKRFSETSLLIESQTD